MLSCSRTPFIHRSVRRWGRAITPRFGEDGTKAQKYEGQAAAELGTESRPLDSSHILLTVPHCTKSVPFATELCNPALSLNRLFTPRTPFHNVQKWNLNSRQPLTLGPEPKCCISGPYSLCVRDPLQTNIPSNSWAFNSFGLAQSWSFQRIPKQQALPPSAHIV